MTKGSFGSLLSTNKLSSRLKLGKDKMKLFTRLLMVISLALVVLVGVHPQVAKAAVVKYAPAEQKIVKSTEARLTQRPASAEYEIKPGDTLSGIAQSHKTTWQSLYCENKSTIGSNPNEINPKVWIKIPHSKVICRIELPVPTNSGTTKQAPPSSTTPVVVTTSQESLTQLQQTALSLLGGNVTQYNCLNGVINIESGWNTYAENASSGAYGIPQALPGSKMSVAGSDWQTDPVTQLRWMIDDYIAPVYGTPCNALEHEYKHGWY